MIWRKDINEKEISISIHDGNGMDVTYQLTDSEKESLKDNELHLRVETIGNIPENSVQAVAGNVKDSNDEYINTAAKGDSSGIVAFYGTSYAAYRSVADGVYTDDENWRKFNEADGLSKTEFTAQQRMSKEHIKIAY